MDTSQARADILARLRAGKPAPEPMPVIPDWEWPGDPVENFIANLESFDGRYRRFATRDDAVAWLKSQPDMAQGKVIYSSAEGVDGNFGEEQVRDLHNACDIDTCVTEAHMGVGEMGSLWVTDSSLHHAACALLSRQLYVLIDAAKIVSGMHQAYAQIDLRKQQYGSFYTGPSATADIEAVHITGAQGPLMLTALIYNAPPKV